MSTKSGAVHHFHIRKRIHQKHEKYPHPNKLKRFFDKLIYVAVIAGPIMSLPQLFRIWFTKSAIGVSFASWSSFAVLSLIWMSYGFLHKQKPIIYTSMGSIIIQILIAVSVLVYS